MAAEEIIETTVCLNCGCEYAGRYCPQCGQALQTSSRITMKTFWKSAALSFSRLTPGFLNTFCGLLTHPWTVIRNYLHGHRIAYSQPVTMVIQLLLYFTFIYTVLGNIFDVNFLMINRDESPLTAGNWLIDMILSSDVISKIAISCLLAFSCYLTYGKASKHDYNMAEYLTAAIYMACCFAIYSNLLKPLSLLSPAFTMILTIAIELVIGTIALNKAFPMHTRWKSAITWLAFMSLNILFLGALGGLIYYLTN